MSIYDNVAFGPRSHGCVPSRPGRHRRGIAARAAIWDELKDRLKKNALGLSGGQQQRLCIARALAVQPEVLLLDESTSALDPISTAKIEELIGQLKERYTVIMVTHNMLQALRISDKTAFFLLGEVVEAGDTDTIFSAPDYDPRTIPTTSPGASGNCNAVRFTFILRGSYGGCSMRLHTPSRLRQARAARARPADECGSQRARCKKEDA